MMNNINLTDLKKKRHCEECNDEAIHSADLYQIASGCALAMTGVCETKPHYYLISMIKQPQ
ncbi:MAG: hypothetical protein LBJ63_08830 [Prevotellaceae bacterium]|jgi:hypothetical protein|nr:hypothetical protein [Prevotellaceae bacterium]